MEAPARLCPFIQVTGQGSIEEYQIDHQSAVRKADEKVAVAGGYLSMSSVKLVPKTYFPLRKAFTATLCSLNVQCAIQFCMLPLLQHPC